MGSKYKPHILDDETFRRSFEMYNDADWYRQAADRLYVNNPLGDIGRGEVAKIGAGQFGDTLLGRAYGEAERGLKESAALDEESLLRRKGRDIEAAKRAGGMGAAAMMRAGSSPGSMGAGILYDRMLQKRTGEIQDRASDELSRGRADLMRGLTSLGTSRAAALPGYLSQAGEWAEAPNRNVAQQSALRNMYDTARTNATKMRLSDMTFEGAKSFWDKFMEGVDDAGKITSTLAGLGGLF
jgi:hypothetical protein